MHLSLVILLAIVVFAIQMTLCVKMRKTMIRLIPAMIITTGIAVCGIVFMVADSSYGAPFAAVIGAVVSAILLAVDGMAWLTYCFIRFIQKVR